MSKPVNYRKKVGRVKTLRQAIVAGMIDWGTCDPERDASSEIDSIELRVQKLLKSRKGRIP